MKKLIPILVAVFAFSACEKQPDSDKLEDGTLVLTEYQQGANFSSFTTFYIPDSVLEINSIKGDTTFVKADYAQAIRSAFIQNMSSRGYVNTTDKSSADLGIQISYAKASYYLPTIGAPWDYDAYWWPGYWHGGWRGYSWYYPYAVTYSYHVGSIIADMINLKGAALSGKLPIIWNAYISGLILPNGGLNTSKAQAGISQAFMQSSYIKK